MAIALVPALRAPRIYRIALCAFFFGQGLTFSSWASRIPDIKSMLHLSDGQLGGLLLGLPAGQLTGLLLSGYVVAKKGSKNVLSIACVLYPASLMLVGLANSSMSLFLSLFALGVFGNFYNISVNTQAVSVERLYGRSIMASFHGVWSLAGFTGGIIGAFMVNAGVSPLHHFMFTFGLVMVLTQIARFYIVPRDQKSTIKASVFTMPDKSVVLLGLIAFACMICEGTMFDWSGIYFEHVVHAPVELSRLGFIAFMSMMATGRFMADYFINKVGAKTMLRNSGIIILSGLSIAVIFPYVITSVIGFMMVGIGVSSVVPITYSMAGKTTTMLSSAALASVSSIGFLGFLIGPPLIGFISDSFGLRIAFSMVALLGLGTTLLSRKVEG
ncbi:MAG TPA: MFS transporter [Flavobacteriales bacterium]